MNMNGAVMTLARYEARQIIKRELYGQGIKLSHVEASEITRKANQYVEDHPEIIAFATERYLDLVKRGVLRPHICVMETSSFVIDFALGFWPRFLSPNCLKVPAKSAWPYSIFSAARLNWLRPIRCENGADNS